MTLPRVLVIVLLVLLLALLLAQTSPVGAQGQLSTPTPLPRIVATSNAAQAAQNAAQAQIAQARADKARADEMERNGEAQIAQAQADISAAREAAATQNGIAIGEAIGRVESTLNQLRDTVNGQAVIIATVTAQTDSQAQTIISMTNELQQARVAHQTVVNAYAAMVDSANKAQAAQATDDTLSYIVKGFLFIVAAVLVVALLWRVISNRRVPQSAPDVVDTSYNVVDNDDTPNA